MNEEQLAKAKEAESAAELLALAKEYGMEDFTEEDAENFYAQMHASGELTDEELENVSGGCSVELNGKNHRVVACDTKCFTNQYFEIVDTDIESDWLRGTWAGMALPGQRCGSCRHLVFKNCVGFCEVEFAGK